MRLEQVKILTLLFISLITIFSSSGVVHADSQTRPYLKTFGGDLMAGGWYKNGSVCPSGINSNYQGHNFSNSDFPTTDSRNGGILTYTKGPGSAASGGNSSQYGAYSVGSVEGTGLTSSGVTLGFYSQGAQPGSNIKSLTFANSSGFYGGLFDGSVQQGNCIPDYYAKKPASPQPVNNMCAAIGMVNSGSAQTDFTSPIGTVGNYDLTAGGCALNVPAGKRITFYIPGNVYIGNNIVYDGSSTIDNVPKFALIAKGSVYIDKNVNQLDGMYVAQPSVNTSAAIKNDTGIIWTCHPNNTNPLDYTYPAGCNKSLVVNGSLVAKQVNFFRVGNGSDVNSTASTAEDNLSTVNSCLTNNCKVSEVVNYTPGLIMGGNFITNTNTGSSSGSVLPIDSIISMPPVF